MGITYIDDTVLRQSFGDRQDFFETNAKRIKS